MAVFPKVLVEQEHSSAWALDRPGLAAVINPGKPRRRQPGAVPQTRLARPRLRGRLHGTSGPVSWPAKVWTVPMSTSSPTPPTGAPSGSRGDCPPRSSSHGAGRRSCSSCMRAVADFVVLADCDQDVHGNNVNDLLAHFGLQRAQHRRARVRRPAAAVTWATPPGCSRTWPAPRGRVMLAGVEELCFYRSGVIDIEPGADVQRARPHQPHGLPGPGGARGHRVVRRGPGRRASPTPT